MADEQLLLRYYIDQARNGQTTFYSGPIYQKGGQRGNGIGSFLSGLFRQILSVLRKGTVAVGKEVINAGSNVLNDISNSVAPQTALKRRSKEVITNLAKKAMYGEGYKRRTSTRKRQCSSTIQSGNIKRRKVVKKKSPSKRKSTRKSPKTKKKLRDIFCK